ncbi:MAG: hypothetical protein GX933_04680 [Chloroflexi bacterium]|nr:hypothetical protein [Chloroflexota bacterium]
MTSERAEQGKGNAGAKLLFILVSGLLIGIILTLVSGFIYSDSYKEKIYAGVTVSGIQIGGLTREEARSVLQTGLRYPFESAFAFKYGADVWHAIPEELGMQIQLDATVDNVWRYGRSGTLLQNLYERISALLFMKHYEPVMLFDERVAFNFISSLAGYIDQPLEQPVITLQGSEVVISPGKSGRELDRELTMTQLHILGQQLRTAEIELPVTVLETTAANLAEQKQVLESLLGQDFVLYVRENDVAREVDRLSADQLAGWINFQPQIDGSQVQIEMLPKREPFYNRLVTVGVDLYQKPQNARFIFNDQTRQLDPLAEAVVGREIDLEASLVNIAESIKQGRHDAEVVMTVSEPKVFANATAQELGITELAISQYTYFYGSSAPRVQNITIGAGSFHGLLVEPGQTFSMAEYLGNIDIDNGYAEAPVIYGGQTIEGVGGGICQVSTTLFRTAYNYGLPIVERHQHAYRVFYYERLANGNIDPGLAGLDASVYVPVLDMKFKNDTPYWILMETYVNPSASSIQWKFYSTKVNRYVETKTSGLTNVVQPEPPVYRENPALATGEVKQVDWEVDGADVDVVRTVYENGQVHLQDRFVTKYEPWQAVFEYGPGTSGMPPEKR